MPSASHSANDAAAYRSAEVPRRLRASALCLAEGRLLVVRLRDPVTGEEALYPPGGAIEEGEGPADADRRETLEETGLALRIDPDIEIVETYPFTWAGVERLVTTHYFAASPLGSFVPALPDVKDVDYNLGASWLPIDAALEALAFHPAIGEACARVVRLATRAGRPTG